jgi:hypothetical protein
MSMSRYIVVPAVECDFDHHSIDGHAIAWRRLRNGVSIFALGGEAGRGVR